MNKTIKPFYLYFSVIVFLILMTLYCMYIGLIDAMIPNKLEINKVEYKVKYSFYNNARLREINANNISGIANHSFSTKECRKYFIDKIGDKFAAFKDSRSIGIYNIKGYYTVTYENSVGSYYYKIKSDAKEDSETVYLFNIDFSSIPQRAIYATLSNKEFYTRLLKKSNYNISKNEIIKIYQIDLDKNNDNDIIVIASNNEKGSFNNKLFVIMNSNQNQNILKLGDENFPYVSRNMNCYDCVSFINYNQNKPALIVMDQGMIYSGYVGRVIYSYENNKYIPVGADFSFAN